MSFSGRLPTPARHLITASAFSNTGDGAYLIAFPLIGSTLTNDPKYIALLAAMATLPRLFLSLPFGALADRFNRRVLMVSANTARIILLMLLVIWLLFGEIEIWHLFIFAFLLGTGEVAFDAAAPAYLPSLVSSSSLPRANGYLATVSEIGNGVIGPALGGLLYSLAAESPILATACFLTLATFFIARTSRYANLSADASVAEGSGNTVSKDPRTILQLLSWSSRHKILRPLFLLVLLWNLIGWLPEGTFVLYVKEELGLEELGFTLLYGASSIGAILGGLIVGRWIGNFSYAAALHISLLGYAILLLPPFFFSSPIIIGIGFFLQGLPMIAWSVVCTSLWQTVVPDSLRGRVSSIFILLSAGMAPIGMLLGGVLADWIGYRNVFLTSGLFLLLVYVFSWKSLNEIANSSKMTKGKLMRSS